jgi:hypothetical protein
MDLGVDINNAINDSDQSLAIGEYVYQAIDTNLEGLTDSEIIHFDSNEHTTTRAHANHRGFGFCASALCALSDEFVFRLNDGNVKRSTLDRIDSIVFGFSGNRLSYKMLVLM